MQVMGMGVSWFVVVAGALVLAGNMTGCGEDGASSVETSIVANSLREVRLCLSGLGAETAQHADEVTFFVKDRAEGNVNKPSGAGDGIVQVAQYEPAGGVRSVPPYMVWIGQPASGVDLGPEEVLGGASGAFVMYMRDPTQGQVRGSRDCLDGFGAPSSMQ
jgi:hypothetical protein